MFLSTLRPEVGAGAQWGTRHFLFRCLDLNPMGLIRRGLGLQNSVGQSDPMNCCFRRGELSGHGDRTSSSPRRTCGDLCDSLDSPKCMTPVQSQGLGPASFC